MDLLLFRGKKATQTIRKMYDEGDTEGIVRLFVPDFAVDAAYVAKDVYFRVWDLYWILALLRILIALCPWQSGYIHPDEFFQSAEVVAGDVFDVDVARTWEFNVTAPIRSMVLPTALFGTPLYALKLANAIVYHYLGVSVVWPYLVLVLPRIVMLAMSFSVDYCVYQICVLYRHSYNKCLTTLASSYVMLVYSTRTFSNSLEMVIAMTKKA